MGDARAPVTLAESNVFLSWSGETSRQLAAALDDWLPLMIHFARPWMSERSIDSGQRWRDEISRHLSVMKIGILCITRESVLAPWLNFEAGALAKSVEDRSRVCPYCWGLKPTDFDGPLGDFNGVEANEGGTWKLVTSLNGALGNLVSASNLRKIFEKQWPDLEAALAKIKEPTPGMGPARTTDEILIEILERVRQLQSPDATLLARAEEAFRIGEPASRDLNNRVTLYGARRGFSDALMDSLANAASSKDASGKE